MTFWGDSTTQLALVMFEIMQGEISSAGGYLEGVNVINMGSSGQTMAGALGSISEIYATNPDLLIICFGINDVRTGGVTASALAASITTAVNLVKANRPNCDIVLWTPNSFLSTDPGSTGYVVPLASAQAYTDVMWNAYNSLVGAFANVVSLDKQQVFGRVCQPTSTLMNDVIHPSNDGQRDALRPLLDLVIPPPPPIDLSASAAAWASNPNNPWTVYSRALEDTRYATLVTPCLITNYTDLGAEVLLYFGAAFLGAPIAPDDFAGGRFIWTPNGVYTLTGDEGRGTIGDGVQLYSGVSKAAFPPNTPALYNARLYKRVGT